MIKSFTLTATSVGSNGSATGEATSENVVNGFLVALSVDYTGEPATTDLTITQVLPALTILTMTDTATDAIKAPRLSCVTTANVAITDSNGYVPLCGYVKIAIAQGDNNGTVAVTFYVWSES